MHINLKKTDELVGTYVKVDEVLAAMRELPKQIAAELKPLLENTDIDTYKHFLITMYHYTLNAEQQLKHAAELCPTIDLRDYFNEMAHEERGHFLLAKRDFEEFGDSAEDYPEPLDVARFRKYWYDLGKENANEFVGAMFVFENVATAVAAEVIAMMERLNLTKKQSRWLRVHLEADVGHGDEAFEMVKRTVRDNPQAMLRAAEDGAREWLAVFKHAFTRPC